MKSIRPVFFVLLVFFFIATVLLLLVRLVLPPFVEKRAEVSLGQAGVEDPEINVRGIGLRSTRLDGGNLRWKGISGSWRELNIQYSPLRLISGEIERVVLSGPEIELDLGEFLQSQEKPEDADMSASLQQLVSPLPQVPYPDTEKREIEASETPAPALPDPVDKPFSPGFSDDGIANLLARFPVEEILVENGLLGAWYQEKELWEGSLKGFYFSRDERINGALELDGSTGQLEVYLDGLPSARSYNAKASLQIALAPSLAVLDEILQSQQFYPDFPEVTAAGSLRMESLLEINSSADSGLSFQGTAPELRIIFPEKKFQLAIASIDLGGTLRERESNLSLGIRMGRGDFGGFAFNSFALAIDLVNFSALSLESELIRFSFKDWQVAAALRGKSSITESRQLRSAEMEISFIGIQHPAMAIEAFSLFLKKEEEKGRLSSSPIGLKKAGTLWVENLEIDWNYQRRVGVGTLDWYNTAGSLVGGLRADLKVKESGGLQGQFELTDQNGATFLHTTYIQAEESRLSLDGRLRLEWMNSLLAWWGNPLSGRLSGSAPLVEAELSGNWPFIKGGFEMEIAGLGFNMDSGAEVGGIDARIALQVNGLPSTRSPQTIHVATVKQGDVAFTDLWIDWEWPTFNRLQISRIEASSAEGELRVEPFFFNPFDPSFQTRLHLTALPAKKVLDWLGEDRFRIEGNISGSLSIGWENGTLILGRGNLQLDDSGETGKFLFSDPAFVRKQFAPLKAVPDQLKGAFIQALTGEGISLVDLEISLEEAVSEGFVSLRIKLSGESKTQELEIPIRGFVINNLISEEDLARLFKAFGPFPVLARPGLGSSSSD